MGNALLGDILAGWLSPLPLNGPNSAGEEETKLHRSCSHQPELGFSCSLVPSRANWD